MFRRLIDRLWESIRKRIDRPSEPENLEWRTDVAEIRATDGGVTFYTRNLSIPTGGGHNADGGMEWIITRVHGNGYSRLLIMVMGGNRPASRIYLQHSGNAPFWNSVWPMPLMDQAKWEIVATNGVLSVRLNGREIWSAHGGYTVTHAVMNGYGSRGSTGQWAIGGR